MSIIAWIVLRLIAGFIAAKIVNKNGAGFFLNIVLGIVGAVVGGEIFTALGESRVTGFNLYSRDGDRGEKNSEREPQDTRVEAGRETGSRVSGNQSRPGYSRRHAKIDAEASLVPRKCPQDIGHDHHQRGALRSLLIHPIEKPE